MASETESRQTKGRRLKQLNSQLARGKILKTEIPFPEGPRFKRLILLNNDFSEDDIYYLLTTSQVDFYKEYGNLQALKGNYGTDPQN